MVLTVGLIATSCKSSRNNDGGKATEKISGVPEDFALEIYHQGCRGTCPDYRINVDAMGNATYNGRRAVELMGKYEKVLGAKVVRDLVKTIKDYDFFEMDDVYGGEVADLPEIHTTVTMDGNTHRVRDVRNAPNELKEMEARLETLIGMEGWQQMEE